MAPGDYQMVVTPPTGFDGPSAANVADLQTLPGAPYAIDVNASFAAVFTLVVGPPLHVDIPLDALTSYLVIDKVASKDTAAVGDFVQYSLTLSNIDTNTTASNVVITDTLPIGLRYQSASVRYDGAPASAPQISTDGRTLKFSVAMLLPGRDRKSVV